MHDDQGSIETAEGLPVTPQEEAAFRALAELARSRRPSGTDVITAEGAEPPAQKQVGVTSAAFALRDAAFDWLAWMERFAERPMHRKYAAELLRELGHMADQVCRAPAASQALPGLACEVEAFLLLTVQRTHGSTDFPAAVHTETVSLVSREDLATSIRQIARHEDAFCAALGPRFIRHRLLGISNITLPVPAAKLLELAGMEDLQALLAEVAA